MRRILFASALAVIGAALSLRALKIADVDTAVTLQLALAAMLFLTAWIAHWIKARKEER